MADKKNQSDDSFLDSFMKGDMPSYIEEAGDANLDEESLLHEVESEVQEEIIMQDEPSAFRQTTTSDYTASEEKKPRSQFQMGNIDSGMKKKLMLYVPLGLAALLAFWWSTSEDDISPTVSSTNQQQVVSGGTNQASLPQGNAQNVATPENTRIIADKPPFVPHQLDKEPVSNNQTALNIPNGPNDSTTTAVLLGGPSDNKAQTSADNDAARTITMFIKDTNKRLDDHDRKLEEIDNKITDNVQRLREDVTGISGKMSMIESRLLSDERVNTQTITRPNIKVQTIGKAIGCVDCITHALIIQDDNLMTITDGDTFGNFTASINNDRLMLKKDNVQYTYYPEK